MKRRDILKLIAAAGITMPFRPLGSLAMPTSPSDPGSAADRVLVLVKLFGGNDGLSTLVPWQNDEYYRIRRFTSPADISLHPEEVLPIHDAPTLGFHPAFAPLMAMYDRGDIAVVNNVGYPNQDFSHFRSTDIWLSGKDAHIYSESGWLGRFFRAADPELAHRFPAAPYVVELANKVGRAMRTDHEPVGIAYDGHSFIPDAPDDVPAPSTELEHEEAFIRMMIRQSNVYLHEMERVAALQIKNQVHYPSVASGLNRDLSLVARFIAGGLATKVWIVNTGMFDTHQFQKELHSSELEMVTLSLKAFFDDLQLLGCANRVTTMVFSEFGRRIEPNGSGTDHGAAAPLFLFGPGVRGGILGGDARPEMPDRHGNISFEIDFRSVYGSVLTQWFNASKDIVYGPVLERSFPELPLFKSSASPGDSIALFPNPAPGGRCTIKRIDRSADPAVVTVVDIRGQVVYRATHQWDLTDIDLALNISPGAYYLDLRSGSVHRSIPFVVA